METLIEPNYEIRRLRLYLIHIARLHRDEIFDMRPTLENLIHAALRLPPSEVWSMDRDQKEIDIVEKAARGE